MSDEIKDFETWEEVILDFFSRKINSDEEKFLKEVIKRVADEYKKQNYFGDTEIEGFFDTKKNKKDKLQSSLAFQRLKFQQICNFDLKPDGIDQDVLEEAYRKRYDEITRKYEPHMWISKASIDAKSVSFATHVAKLTHSKIDSPSLLDQITAQKPGVLATADLKEKIVDGAVAGNQFAPVFQFLELELNGDKLATVFADEENTVLQVFSQEDDVRMWNEGFKQSLSVSKLSSHSLAKQIYFPVMHDKKVFPLSYHLLCHLKSSSLAHAIFEVLTDSNQKKIKSKKDKCKYTVLTSCSFPQRACVKVTASNHSNASQLNGKRGGRLHLFNSRPPTWQRQLKPPSTQLSLFQTNSIYYQVKETVGFLRDFLLRNQRLDLSIRDPKKKKWIDDWVNQIIDEIMIYAISIQNLPAGWSRTENIKLKPAHQYFLDPYRDDGQFQAARQSVDWQTAICADFANWLNGRLKGKDKKFTPQPEHTKMWKQLMEKELRIHAQAIDWDIKDQTREKQA